ncbi:MAG: phosphoribosylglycinamide synthetase [Pseudomonadota bacterium]
MQPLQIPQDAKEKLRFLYIAKHALWGGTMHPEDGNHAIYHHEVRSSLEQLGINLDCANSYEVLYEHPNVDMVFPLLNRGGFVGSEMLLPLLCNKHGVAYVGAGPFVRGLGDDKATSKMLATHHGVPTAPWFCYRRGAPVLEADCPKAQRWVIKPNASSASWAISDASTWLEVADAVRSLHGQGHDALVEPYIDGYDVQVAFICNDGPKGLPMLIYEREDTQRLWTYYEKRDLIENTEKDSLKQFDDAEHGPKIAAMANTLAQALNPFDYGRFEFRLDLKTGDINFIEVNLNCNLWSKKVMATAAALAGFSHGQLLETILAEALRRHHLIA